MRKIALAPNWNSPAQGGEMTRKDLARLFGGQGATSESSEGDAPINVYPEIPYLAPAAVAKKVLKLDETPRTVEGIDIAHLGGGETVASVVQFLDGLPFKPGYRRYKIRTEPLNAVRHPSIHGRVVRGSIDLIRFNTYRSCPASGVSKKETGILG